MFEVNDTHKQYPVPQFQRACYTLGDRVMALGHDGDGVVVPEAICRRDKAFEALRYLPVFHVLQASLAW